MRFDNKESLEKEYKERFDSMWKKSQSLSAKKSFFGTIISKLKLQRRMLLWRKEIYQSIPGGYSILRNARRIGRICGIDRH